MNKLIIEVKAMGDPEVRNFEEDQPNFVTVFCVHTFLNSRGDKISHTMPIVCKFKNGLAKKVNSEIRKGCIFTVEGKLAYYKNFETGKESYSIIVDNIENIHLPRGQEIKTEQIKETEEVV